MLQLSIHRYTKSIADFFVSVPFRTANESDQHLPCGSYINDQIILTNQFQCLT